MLAGGVFGFYSGNLSDRFGRQSIMIAGCVGSVAAYYILATAATVAGYSLGAFLVGLCRAVLESPSKAVIADAIDDRETRELAYHGRYFLLNLGAAAGPVLGFTFGLAARQTTFWITCGTYAVFLVVLIAAFRIRPERPLSHSEDVSLRGAVRVLLRDHRFMLLLVANFLTLTAYIQYETTLVQYLNLEGGGVVVGLFTALITTNALTIVVFQFPLLRLLERFDLYSRAYAGLVLFILGFAMYTVLPVTSYSGWIFATWVLSMGEAILFPTLNLQVDRMAPSHLKGSYFGASALGGLGFSFGPLVGGITLQLLGGPGTFAIMVVITAVGGAFYWQSSRVSQSQ
jgi:MFS family permease